MIMGIVYQLPLISHIFVTINTRKYKMNLAQMVIDLLTAQIESLKFHLADLREKLAQKEYIIQVYKETAEEYARQLLLAEKSSDDYAKKLNIAQQCIGEQAQAMSNMNNKITHLKEELKLQTARADNNFEKWDKTNKKLLRTIDSLKEMRVKDAEFEQLLKDA